MASADIVKMKMEFMDTFNRYTRCMLLLIIKKDNDQELDSARRKLDLAIRGDPAFIMNNLGPYLVTFQDKIRERDQQWFVKRSYADLTENEYGDLIISKLKEKWHLCSKKERTLFGDCFNAMLVIFCGYKYLVKNNKLPELYEMPSMVKLPKVESSSGGSGIKQ
jgi:hypothetical protein